MAIVQVRGAGLTVDVPHTQDNKFSTAQINWIEKLDEVYLRAGFTYIGPIGDPRVGGGGVLLIRKDDKQGLKAILDLTELSVSDMLFLARINDLEVADV